jgi:hypothetical protein
MHRAAKWQRLNSISTRMQARDCAIGKLHSIQGKLLEMLALLKVTKPTAKALLVAR